MNDYRSLGRSEQCRGISVVWKAGVVDRGRLPPSMWSELIRFNRRHNDFSSTDKENSGTHRQYIKSFRDCVNADISDVLCVQVRCWSIHRCTKVTCIGPMWAPESRGQRGGKGQVAGGNGNWHQWINVDFFSRCVHQKFKTWSWHVIKANTTMQGREEGQKQRQRHWCIQLLHSLALPTLR